MNIRLALCCVLATVMPAVVEAQGAPEEATERLSLEAALRLAVENNRQLQGALLEVEKAEEQVAVSRTRRLPNFETEISASQLVTPVDFAFPRGAFGDFPGTGPIPSVDTNVTVSRQPTAYMSSQISQPLTQLGQINLGIRNAEATRDIARERVRAQ